MAYWYLYKHPDKLEHSTILLSPSLHIVATGLAVITIIMAAFLWRRSYINLEITPVAVMSKTDGGRMDPLGLLPVTLRIMLKSYFSIGGIFLLFFLGFITWTNNFSSAFSSGIDGNQELLSLMMIIIFSSFTSLVFTDGMPVLRWMAAFPVNRWNMYRLFLLPFLSMTAIILVAGIWRGSDDIRTPVIHFSSIDPDGKVGFSGVGDSLRLKKFSESKKKISLDEAMGIVSTELIERYGLHATPEELKKLVLFTVTEKEEYIGMKKYPFKFSVWTFDGESLKPMLKSSIQRRVVLGSALLLCFVLIGAVLFMLINLNYRYIYFLISLVILMFLPFTGMLLGLEEISFTILPGWVVGLYFWPALAILGGFFYLIWSCGGWAFNRVEFAVIKPSKK